MKRILAGLLLAVALVTPVRAAEQITLTTPIQTTLTAWQPVSFYANRGRQLVIVEVVSDTGVLVQATYPTPAINNACGVVQPTGQALISSLNTVNLSTNSLWKRILQRLQTDCYIGAGTITGTPD